MDRTSFAQALKAARQAAGLSQTSLAERAALTAPYISLLESGRRRPPRPDLIERLAQALGVAPEALLELAALERTPGSIRKRLEGIDRERSRVNRARDRMLSTTLFNLSRHPEALADMVHGSAESLWLRSALGRVGGRMKGVGSAREARARSHEMLDALPAAERDRLLEALPEVLGGPGAAGPAPTAATPTPAAEHPATLLQEVRDGLGAHAKVLDHVHVDARHSAAGCFWWRLASDEGWPRLEAGDLLLVDPTRAPKDGDLVALRHHDHDLVRVLRRRASDEVRLESLRSDAAPLRLAPRDFAPAGVVLRVIRSLV